MADARQWVKDLAPADVVETIGFLERSGYELAQTRISSSFGDGQLRFSGEFDVVITRDRGQWHLDVVTADGEAFQLDLIAAGRACHYPTEHIEGMPVQLPPWLSWHEELPGLLEWLKSPGAREKVQFASDERYVLMWPNSPKAQSIRARWKQEGLNPSTHGGSVEFNEAGEADPVLPRPAGWAEARAATWPPANLEDLGPRWYRATKHDEAQILTELRAEMPAGHALSGVSVQVVAAKKPMKDVVLWLPENGQWAWVHLTYRQETDPRFPRCGVYATWQEMLEDSL